MSVNVFENGKLKKIAGGPKEINVSETSIHFESPENREAIESGNTVSTVFGKIQKWLSDLKPVAFSGKLDDTDRTAENQLILKSGYGVGGLHGDGTENAKWYNFARIITTDTYVDYPIELTVGKREYAALSRASIVLDNSTHDIRYFYHFGNPNVQLYAYRFDENTINLFINGNEHDNIYLHDVKINALFLKGTRVECPSVYLSTLPAGGLYAKFYNPPSDMGWNLLSTIDVKQADGTVRINYDNLDPQPKEFCIRYGGSNGPHIYGGGSVTTPNDGADPFMLPIYRGVAHIGIAYIFVYSSNKRIEMAFTDTTDRKSVV